MVDELLKNKEFNCWLIAFLVLTIFPTLFVNVVFAQSNMSENSQKLLDLNDFSASSFNENGTLSTDISKSNTTVSGENREVEKGEINVDTSISWKPDSLNHYEDIIFNISGPEKYSGSDMYWSKSDVSPGTYIISYGPINGYETPASDTKTLIAGGSIDFSGTYTLKKRFGDTIDFGDGYILLIKKIDYKKKEMSIELQLDGLAIGEKRIIENDTYVFQKYGEDRKIYITPLYISLDSGGEYTNVYIKYVRFTAFRPHTYLSIVSIPEGAAIYRDETYVGKTSKNIPESDLDTHYIHLELNGYDSWEAKYKFDSLDEPKEMKAVLINTNNVAPAATERKPTAGPTPSTTEATPSTTEATPSTTEGTPAKIEENPAKIKRTPANKEATPAKTEPLPTKTEESPTKAEKSLPSIKKSVTTTDTLSTTIGNEDTPDFLGITVLIILLIECLIMKKNR